MEEKYYSISEIAEMYKLNISTVKSWIYRDKKLKAIKIGGAVRVKESDLKEIITEIN